MAQSEHVGDLMTALAKAQSEMKAAVFNRVNPHFKNKYADLPAVIEAIKPLSKHGIAYAQTTKLVDGMVTLCCKLCLAEQWIDSDWPVAPVGVKPQEMGSALTYARRYSLQTIAGIAGDDDDDGNATDGKAIEAGPITSEQARELGALLDDVGGKKAEDLTKAFLKYCKIAALPLLPASEFENAKARIEAKRKKPDA